MDTGPFCRRRACWALRRSGDSDTLAHGQKRIQGSVNRAGWGRIGSGRFGSFPVSSCRVGSERDNHTTAAPSPHLKPPRFCTAVARNYKMPTPCHTLQNGSVYEESSVASRQCTNCTAWIYHIHNPTPSLLSTSCPMPMAELVVGKDLTRKSASGRPWGQCAARFMPKSPLSPTREQTWRSESERVPEIMHIHEA
ncbi:unnamed protein product [Protopolystoma xenopodis]|uniref:Uncharacterized protein n=1 Tax=Protopolystoma xenopodis TaxID=117903 RepID=A0A3S5A1F0_9PLAT|nr:unnamed protein product [Protopolystoma xenopodis]